MQQFMKLNIVVLMKQVPDTQCVCQDTLNADGTINRAALPTIINPDDNVALEQALRLKEQFAGSKVTVLTMGLPTAQVVVKEGLYRGADAGYVLCDAQFAGSDTLATSQVLSAAIKQLGSVDLIFAGQQTLDGDTAHVGPQVACMLDIPAITAASAVSMTDAANVEVKRWVDEGAEVVQSTLPALVTMNVAAMELRPRHAKWVMTHKNTAIEQWTAADLNMDVTKCGLHGSATQVTQTTPIILQKKEQVCFAADDMEALVDLLQEGGVIS